MERVLTVAQLDRRLREVLEADTDGLLVGGEVTALKEQPSGHAYFCLRDEREDAGIDCVMYRSAPVRARKLLADGARLVLRGRVTFYAPRGRAQLVVEAARPAGRGALLEALERLKKKLAGEGLFAPERKRPLPKEPRVVGVVTSAQGAALADIVRVAFRRGRVRLVLVNAPVQGPGAGAALARALRLAAKHPEIEAIILGRGGGSTEDLMAFNEEDLVRAVAACPVPVVAAIGHEVDVTLVDLAADVRAATPSQAAELLVPDARARLAMLKQLEARLVRAARRRTAEGQQRLDDLGADLRARAERHIAVRRASITRLERRLAARHPAAVLRAASSALAPLERRLAAAGRRLVAERRAEAADLDARARASARARVAEARARLGQAAIKLDALSPLAVLGRGYALVRRADGRLVRRASQVEVGEAVEVRLSEGALGVEVRRRTFE